MISYCVIFREFRGVPRGTRDLEERESTMARVCEYSGKHSHVGRRVVRRGKAKKQGGVGQKVTGISKRTWRPNLQTIRVMDENGLRLQFGQVAIRNLFRAVDALPLLYGVGGVACLLSKRWQRFGDFAAGTIVVRHVDTAVHGIESIEPGKYNSFRAYPHLEARLRQRVSAREAALALQALMRRETLEPQPRILLFKELADHYRSLVPFPEEATFALTDEQYVRNAVESIFRAQH